MLIHKEMPLEKIWSS